MYIKLEYLSDTFGNNYIGVNIYKDAVQPYLDKLKKILGEEFETYTNAQKVRDRNKFHITVINVMEYNKLCKEIGMDKVVNEIEKMFEIVFDDVNLMGIGMAERNENKAYFVVVKSEQLQEVRRKFDLPEQDFHITLGFHYKDVFGVRKNEVLPEVDPFLELLRGEYVKNRETFDFIKFLPNFDDNPDLEVEPIKIKDSFATFRIGEKKYYTISLIGDSLAISAKWVDDDKKPILPNTLIYRIMNKK